MQQGLKASDWFRTGNKIAIIGGEEMRYCADEGKTKCDRTRRDSWETFTVHVLGPDTVAFKGGHHHKWCSDDHWGQPYWNCNRDHIRSHEKFQIVKVSGQGSGVYAMIGHREGRKFCSDGHDDEIRCKEDRFDTWER